MTNVADAPIRSPDAAGQDGAPSRPRGSAGAGCSRSRGPTTSPRIRIPPLTIGMITIGLGVLVTGRTMLVSLPQDAR